MFGRTKAAFTVMAVAFASIRLVASDAPMQKPDAGILRNLTTGLADTNVDARRAAARGVFESAEPVRIALLPRLRELLRAEKDGQVRLWLFDALTAMGPDAAEAVPDLVFSMRSSFGGSRTEKAHQDYRAAMALAAIGKPSVQALKELLADPGTKENVRAESIMALGRIGKDAKPAIPDLVPLLGHESERLRRETIVATGSIGPASVPALIQASKDTNPRVRAGAVAALGGTKSKDPAAIDSVTAASRDSAAEVRIAAVEALSGFDLPDDRLLAGLRQAMNDADAKVVQAAIRGLVARPSLLGPALPDLERVIAAGPGESAKVAAFAIAATGEGATARLLKALERPESPVEAIAEALVLQGRQASPQLSAALASENPRVRRGCALALGTIRPLEAETPARLAAGLKDPDEAVRGAFLKALGELGPRARPVVPDVRALLDDTNPATRAQAVDVLFLCSARDERLVEDLTGKLADSATPVQVAALDRLRALGPLGRKALPQATARLGSPDDAVRKSAAAMIASHGAGAGEAVPALAAALENPDRDIRILAVKTLARIGRPAQVAFPKFEPLSKSENVDEREAVFQAIGNLGLDADAVRPVLTQGLRDAEERVRRAAIGAVGQLGPAGAVMLPDLIRIAANPKEQRSVERAVRRYERRGPDPRTVPDLIALSKHDKENVQLLAIRFLALVRPTRSEIENAFEAMKDHASETVRKKAAEALQEIRSKPGGENPAAKPSNAA